LQTIQKGISQFIMTMSQLMVIWTKRCGLITVNHMIF